MKRARAAPARGHVTGEAGRLRVARLRLTRRFGPFRGDRGSGARGFTLIELLTALLILSLLALMSYRGLGAVLDAREHVRQETEKWRRVASFVARFERDVQLAAPRPVRSASGVAPAWRGRPDATLEPRLEFSRFASAEGVDTARRLAYRLNEKQEVELWLWPGLDIAPDVLPARYPVLAGVTRFEVQYLTANLAWVDAWPTSTLDPLIPQAVQLRIVLASGEEIVRVLALKS
jgi:general secretion pathway protein J